MCGVGDGPKVQATQQPALKRSSASGRPSYQRRLLQESLLSLIWGITTGCLSYAPKGKLPAGVCLIIIGTEGTVLTDNVLRGEGDRIGRQSISVHEHALAAC